MWCSMCALCANTLPVIMYCMLCSSAFWPYLHCLDGYLAEKNPEVGEKCAMQVDMDWDKIDSCRSGSLGHK